MTVGVCLRPANVNIAVVLRMKNAQEIAREIAQSWEALHPEIIQDAEVNLDDENTRYLLVEDTEEYEHTAYPREEYAELERLRYREKDQFHESLVTQITVMMIHGLIGERQMFHAAALGNAENKRAVALIAESGTGKTTASHFLGERFTYLTDETVIVDEDRTVTPYLKPQSVITDPARPKQQISPEKMGLNLPEPDAQFKLTAMVILTRDKSEGYTAPVLKKVHLADALLKISAQTSGLGFTDRGVEKLIDLIVACGGVLRLEYSEISESLPLLIKLLNEPTPTEAREPIDIAYADNTKPAHGELARAADTSGYRIDDRVLLMQETQLSEVSFFAGDLWFELETPRTPQDLHRRLEELYEEEIPYDAFEKNLSELMGLGVIDQGRARAVAAS